MQLFHVPKNLIREIRSRKWGGKLKYFLLADIYGALEDGKTKWLGGGNCHRKEAS